MIDEKKIPQRIYIKDSQLAECEIEGVADARINAVPYKGGSGKICEYINVESLWHDASEEPEIDKPLIIQYMSLMNEVSYDKDRRIAKYSWKLNVEWLRIIKWCYFDDLLPKGGEG